MRTKNIYRWIGNTPFGAVTPDYGCHAHLVESQKNKPIFSRFGINSFCERLYGDDEGESEEEEREE